MIARLLLANALELVVGVGAATILRAPLAASYLLGFAVVGIVSAHLALVHVGFGWLGLSLLAAASLVAIWRWASWRPALPRPNGWAVAGTAALVALVVHVWPTFAAKPLDDYDAWAIWGMKAKALTLLGWADPALFASDAARPAHLDYPLLVPSLEAVAARAMGAFDPRLVHLQFLLLGVAGLAAIYGFLRGRAAPWLLWPVLLALALAPGLASQLLTAYADVPLAFFVAGGVLAAERWTNDASPRALALAAVFLGAACLTKDEGIVFAVATLTAAGLAARRVRPLLVTGLAIELVLLPWQLFLGLHRVHSDTLLGGHALDFTYPGIGPVVMQWLLERAFSVHEWIVLPLVFFLAVLAAAGSRIAVFSWAWALLAMLGLTWIYVTSELDWSTYVYYSGHRVIDSALVTAAALTPLLTAEALRIDRR